ncbi:MAG: hypothetical protein KAX19_03100 [Candidatus Brocadiae bacterium]|nr:hypothetical protein [Candidatus Brocadiia bacterium]
MREHQLPQRPWGTGADDVFLSLEAAIDKDGRRQDLSQETLANDSSRPVVIRLTKAGQVSNEVLRKYVHHQDHAIRVTAARKVMGVNSGYIGWRSPGGEIRKDLMLELIQSKDPMRTLWDKEVLLMRGTFKFPPLRPDHLYRIRVGSGQHVGSGDGYKIYINGKQLVEALHGNGRRMGAKPRGGYITKEFVEEFNKGEVTIAATTFLRYGNRAIVQMPPVPQGIFSVWLEEMKLPTLDDDAVRKSATVIPMFSSQWQAKQNPDNAELRTENDMFLYDGRFVANPRVLGSWKVIDQVKTIDEFNLEKKMNPGRPPFTKMTFKDKGMTDKTLWIWSGDTLMDLDRYQALKMTVKKIEGSDCLFIETGGFSTRNPAGWQPPLYVLKRVGK